MVRFSFIVMLSIVACSVKYHEAALSIRTAKKNVVSTTCSFLSAASIFLGPSISSAGMLTFPLPADMKNNIVLVRCGECFADERHEVQTNPVKKLRQDNALTEKGRLQVVEAAKKINEMGFQPTYIWTSNTERAYESAAIMARELQLGQNRIIPEYSFLDARSAGIYEGKNDADTWKEIHRQDEEQGTKYRPPPNNDGTPTESVSDVLVRGNQLVSTIESMYSGENVIILSPDSENLSILQAALADEEPDKSLPLHSRFAFNLGDVKKLDYVVKQSELLVTGQTREEADSTIRKMRAMRVAGTSRAVKSGVDSWLDLWKIASSNIGTQL